METFKKEIIINAPLEKTFQYMDDLSKTGMHMSESSMMMMGSKLTLEELTPNLKGVGATYRWYGKMMGMTIDLTEKITKWEENKEKVWETIGNPKIIVLGSYRIQLNVSRVLQGTLAKLQISYTRPNGLFYKIVSFLFADFYCRWCLNNMLNDSKNALEKNMQNVSETFAPKTWID